MVGEQEQRSRCLFRDNAVAEEAEEVDSIQASTTQRQPINHATNRGFRESRGEPGGDSQDSTPGCVISGARGPEWQAIQACSARGREFFAAVSAVHSPLFQSREIGEAQSASTGQLLRMNCTEALGSIRSPALPRCPGPPFTPSDALAVGQQEVSGALVGRVHITRTNAGPGSAPAMGGDDGDGVLKSSS